MFSVRRDECDGRGRIGCLQLGELQPFSTPLLFPVVCLITGTSPRGGGLWKYILHKNKHGVLNRDIPVMSQVLHFRNFIPTKKSSIECWRRLGIRERYNNEPGLLSKSYTAPIFFDSGGFQLLRNDSIDLSIHGLPSDKKDLFKTVLELQKDFGGGSSSNIIATLDYPLLPNLVKSEAKKRMDKSIRNALATAQYLQESSDYQPFLYVAVHGQDRKSIGNYVKKVFKEFQDNGVEKYPFGLAIGSLVPLRGAKKNQTIIELLRGVQENIPEEFRNRVPIHTFGITGNLIPILTYLGIDSFDSSTYVQETRGLTYIDHETGYSRPILETDEWRCDCPVCCTFRENFTLRHLQDALTSETKRGGEQLPDGIYKSEFYGYLALHNLEMDFRILKRTQEAIQGNYLQEYLIQHVEKYPRLQLALDAIAVEDEKLRTKLSRVIVSMPTQLELSFIENSISLELNPKSFNILQKRTYNPKDKRLLLIIPCSGGKPYSKSRSHQFITGRLSEVLNGTMPSVHKVTLSGLYGPVPENYESEKAIVSYDFQLDPLDVKQINLLVDRLAAYLERFGEGFDACVGYATSRAYRTVLEEVATRNSRLVVLPENPKSRRFTEFYRRENVLELLEYVANALKVSDNGHHPGQSDT